MNINFELYRIFYAVANNENITNAAKELMISQPAISKSIKNLEEQLGGQLFVRTRRGVSLTEEGREFYNYIKQAIEYINSAENKFQDLINLDSGLIRIGISSTLTEKFFLPYLEEFHKLYPKVEIQILTNISSTLFPKLRDGLVDLMIINLPCEDYNGVEIINIKEIHDCFIVNNSYSNIVNKRIKLEELNNFPLILQNKESNTRKFIDDFCLQNNIVLKPNMDLASYKLVVEFTKIGLGIGYATKEYIKDDLESKKLFELDIEPSIPSRNIGLAFSKKNLLSFSAKKLIDIILKDKKENS